MIRTQVSLDKAEYESAKKEAKRQGISVAEFIRRAMREKLPSDTSRPGMRYAGMVTSGDPESSLSVDEIVYGRKG